MNRLRRDDFSLVDPHPKNNISTLASGHASSDIHSFFVPVKYEPNYNYPVVIWLHNNRSSQKQLTTVLPQMSLQNYLAAGVRAPQAIDSMGHEFQWLESEAGIAISEQAVFSAIDELAERHSIDSQRIFIAGLHEGGTMALRIALRQPDLFAGAISLGGEFPKGVRPLANLNQVKSIPMLLALANSQAYPIDELCSDLRVLHSAKIGMDIRQYDVPHELNPAILKDVNQWIMGQVTGTKTLETAELCDTVPVEFSVN